MWTQTCSLNAPYITKQALIQAKKFNICFSAAVPLVWAPGVLLIDEACMRHSAAYMSGTLKFIVGLNSIVAFFNLFFHYFSTKANEFRRILAIQSSALRYLIFQTMLMLALLSIIIWTTLFGLYCATGDEHCQNSLRLSGDLTALFVWTLFIMYPQAYFLWRYTVLYMSLKGFYYSSTHEMKGSKDSYKLLLVPFHRYQ